MLCVVTTSCSFSPAATARDGNTDGMDGAGSDHPLVFSADPTSHKIVPANRMEWADFITKSRLNIFPPDSVWLLQEPLGNFADSIGTVALSPNNTPRYKQAVQGWSRTAVAMDDNSTQSAYNHDDPSLPSASLGSMTVLVYYANATAAGSGLRTILIAGSSNPQNYGEVVIDSSSHLGVIAYNGPQATGTHVYDNSVTPIVVKLDKTHQAERVFTQHETIAVTPFVPPQYATGGIFIGGASHKAPDGRWLYMAAWYNVRAEMADSDVTAMIAALGF